MEKYGLDNAMRQMIWPEFVDEDANTIGSEVPLSGKLNAKMHIFAVSEDAPSIELGTEFYFGEGARLVAEGIVTDVLIS